MDGTERSDNAFEARLEKLLPRAPSSSLEERIAAGLAGRNADDPRSGTADLEEEPELENLLRRLRPEPMDEARERDLESELAGDRDMERLLGQLHPAGVSRGTESAVFAQMSLHSLDEQGATGGWRDGGSGHGDRTVRGPRPRWALWSARAAAVAVACAILRYGQKPGEQGFWSKEEPVSVASEAAAQKRQEGDRPSGGSRWSARIGLGSESESQPAAVAGPSSRSRDRAPRPGAAAGGGRAEERVANSPQSPRAKGGESAGRSGAGGPEARAVSGEPGEEPSGFVLETLGSKRMASGSPTPLPLEGAGIASSVRAIVSSGKEQPGAAPPGTGAREQAESLVEALAQGKATEILPESVLAWIGETQSLSSIASTNVSTRKPDGEPITRPTEALAPTSVGGNPASTTRNPGATSTAGVQPPPGGESNAVAPSGRVVNPSVVGLTEVGAALPTDSVTTSPAGTQPRLGAEPSVASTNGRVVEPPVTSNMGGNDSARRELGEVLLFEETDATVKFHLVQSGSVTVARFLDGSGTRISEGVVRASGDVARIAQEARAVIQADSANSVPKGD
jgi:hypothetical protein